MSIRRVGVLGLGLMGSGIAQITAAVAGLPVVAVEASQEAIKKGRAAISKSLAAVAARAVAKGAMDAAGGEAYVGRAEANITATTDRAALAQCDIVIEAAPEDWAFKAKLYRDLRAHIAPSAILASNTSGLLIADLAREFGAPERVLGLHYFNPVPIMQLCEVVSTPQTLRAHVDAATALVKLQGKTPVGCKDSAGFIVNRLLVPFLAQAIRLHEEGVASTADIDVAMKLGCGHPMGPLELADYVGLVSLCARAGATAQGSPHPHPAGAPPPICRIRRSTSCKIGRQSTPASRHFSCPRAWPSAWQRGTWAGSRGAAFTSGRAPRLSSPPNRQIL